MVKKHTENERWKLKKMKSDNNLVQRYIKAWKNWERITIIRTVRKYNIHRGWKDASARTVSASQCRAVSERLFPCCRLCGSSPETECVSPEPPFSPARPLGSQISSVLSPTHTQLCQTVGEGGEREREREREREGKREREREIMVFLWFSLNSRCISSLQYSSSLPIFTSSPPQSLLSVLPQSTPSPGVIFFLPPHRLRCTCPPVWWGPDTLHPAVSRAEDKAAKLMKVAIIILYQKIQNNYRAQKNLCSPNTPDHTHWDKAKKNALAGSRTRIYCLEGNNADRYTTNANYWDVLPLSFCHCSTPVPQSKLTSSPDQTLTPVWITTYPLMYVLSPTHCLLRCQWAVYWGASEPHPLPSEVPVGTGPFNPSIYSLPYELAPIYPVTMVSRKTIEWMKHCLSFLSINC